MDENKGKIISLNEKGFGFMRIDGRDSGMFFHASSLVNAKFADLFVGDELSFESIERNEKGECATGVTLLGRMPA